MTTRRDGETGRREGMRPTSIDSDSVSGGRGGWQANSSQRIDQIDDIEKTVARLLSLWYDSDRVVVAKLVFIGFSCKALTERSPDLQRRARRVDTTCFHSRSKFRIVFGGFAVRAMFCRSIRAKTMNCRSNCVTTPEK